MDERFKVKKKIRLLLKDVAYYILSRIHELDIKIRDKAFYCTVLNDSGTVSHVYINSDGTVACNCHDYLGRTFLGNILKQDFESIYYSEETMEIKNKLKNGHLPFILCSACTRLKKINKKNYPEGKKGISIIHDLVIENTVLCNYGCKGCDRKGVYFTREKKSLSLEDFKVILSRFTRYKNSIIGLHNLGEPCLHKEFPQQLELINRTYPEKNLFFSSNGSAINKEIREAIVSYVDTIEISIDGSTQEMAEKYQIGINFQNVVKNLKALVRARDESKNSRTKIYWKYVLFHWNDRHRDIVDLVKIAKESNVDGILFAKARSPLLANPIHWIFNEKEYYKDFALEDTGHGETLLRIR